MKKISLTFLLFCLYSVHSTAIDIGSYFLSNGFYYQILSTGTVSCVEPSSATTITIPEIIKPKFWNPQKEAYEEHTFTVTGIGDDYAREWGHVKILTLPNTIVKFYGSGFEFDNLEKVNIPSKITKLGNTFSSAPKLKQVIIPSNSNLQEIGHAAFLDCVSLTDIKLPNSVTKIGLRAFQGCEALKEIEIPTAVKTIEEEAFKACSKLKTVKFSSSSKLETIGEGAFWGCTSLSLLQVGAYWTTSRLPNGIYEIKDETFRDCAIADIELSNNIKTIGYLAFCNNRVLTRIIIPDNVTRIYESAFEGCSKLKLINLPASLEYIGSGAFSYCSSIEDIYSHRINPVTIDYSTFDESVYRNAKLYVHQTSKYKETYAWSEFKRVRDIDGSYTFHIATYDITASGSGEVIIPKDQEYDLGAGYKLLPLFDGATVRDEHKLIEVRHWVTQFGYEIQFVPDNGYKVDQVLYAKSKTAELRDVTSELEPNKKRDGYTIFFNDMASGPVLVVTFGPKGGSNGKKGDLSGDGEVNGTDLVQIVKLIVEGKSDVEAADLNGDGEVNGTDLVKLVNMILGKE